MHDEARKVCHFGDALTKALGKKAVESLASLEVPIRGPVALVSEPASHSAERSSRITYHQKRARSALHHDSPCDPSAHRVRTIHVTHEIGAIKTIPQPK